MKKLLCISLAMYFASFSNEVYSQSSNSIQNETPRFSAWNLLTPNKAQFPTRAFGKPIQIIGFTAVDKQNAKQAAEAFLKQEQKTLGIDLSAVKFKSVRGFNKLNYVTFIQNHNGIDVLRTEVELRITNSGKVMAYGATYYNDIKSLNTVPSVSSAICAKAATQDLKISKDIESIQSGSRLYILPVKKFGTTEFKLVYAYQFNTAGDSDEFLAYVDAHTGTIVERKSIVKDAESKIKFVANVNRINPTDPTAVEPVQNLNFKLGNTQYITDSNGEAKVNISSPTKLSATADSKYCEIISTTNSSGKISLNINPDADTTISLDDYWNKHQRNAYYYLQLGRNTLYAIDPEIIPEIADRKISINLDYESDQINASSGGEIINVYGLQLEDNKILEMSDVLLHEYGHSINRFTYTTLQENMEGMINDASNEALADIFSVYNSDNSVMGKGFISTEPNTGIRNLKNINCYPDSIQGESHHDGLILSGAFWDLKELTSLEYLKKISHFAKYGLPDNEDTGLAFAEWFVEVLIADDNMGEGNQDLSDGTPHFDQILTAFNNHKIGTELFPLYAFSHSPLKDTADALKQYSFNYSFNIPNSRLLQVDSSFVVYSINNSEKINRIRATTSDNYTFTAVESEIPVGSFLQYHIIAYTNGSVTPIYFYENNISQTPYSCLVGFRTLLTDNFEKDTGWTFGAAEDNATKGLWEIALPDQSAYYMPDLLPTEDHSEVGYKFLVTDPVFDINYFMTGFNTNWTDGRTSVISPKYDISQAKYPLISFYYWLYFGYLSETDQRVSLNIYTSDDDGKNWKLASAITESDPKWNRKLIGVEPSKSFRVKFEMDTPEVYDRLLVMLKAFIDDFSILYTGNEINAVDDTPQLSRLTIFPNPATSNLYIEAMNADKVEIYNSLGQLVKSIDISSGNAEWNRTTDNGEIVPAGLYLCKTTSGDNTITKTVIIEN